MNGKQLKNSILQWAIQGKLVPQDPNDEPASVLLEKIRTEKARLIKEGKIKKDKNESFIFRGDDNSYYEKFLATGEVKCINDEIPFEIPQGWEWCRLGYIFSHSTGKALNGTNRKGNLYTYITTSNLYWDRFELSSLKEMYFTEEELGKCTATKGDLLVCEGGDIGRSAIWNYDYNIRIQNHIHKLRSYIPLCTRFFYYVMYLYKGIGYIGGKGIGIQGLSSGALHNILIPTPSINEQKRIVSQIEAIMPIAAKYEKSQEELNQLNDSIHNRLRKSILQEAIQGKLVPQILEEGTAQELLEQIRQEKQKLVKEGKLKKFALSDSVIYKGDDNKYYEQIGKELIDITEQIPFDIPDSWNWVRGRFIFLPMESIKPTSDFIYIDVDAVNNRTNVIDNPKTIRAGHAPSRATRKLHKYDVLFSMVRPYLKNIVLVDSTYKEAIASTGFYVITPSIGLYPKFLFNLMLSSYVVDGLNSFIKGDNSPSINNCHIENFLYPLPPIKEQQRIVAQIVFLFEQLH